MNKSRERLIDFLGHQADRVDRISRKIGVDPSQHLVPIAD